MFCVGARAAVRETTAGTVRLVLSPPRPIRSIMAPVHLPALTWAIVRFLAAKPGPHVVHGFGSWAMVAAAACRLLERRGVRATPIGTAWTTMVHESAAKLDSEVVRGSPRLWLQHRAELAWSRLVVARAERWGYRNCRYVIVNYEATRRLLEESFGPGLSFRRLTYAPPTAYGPSPTVNAPPPADLPQGDAPLVVATSRHDGRKGLAVLIRALALLRDKGVRFRACLVGPGLLLGGHRALVRELGLAGQVALPGRVPEVDPYLGAADVFCLPSHEEGSGSVSALEALRKGVAIVSTNVDGMPEDLSDGENALLVAPGDVAALAGALERLLSDEAYRARLGQAGRERYETRFSPEAAARDLGELYAELGLSPARRMASAT